MSDKLNYIYVVNDDTNFQPSDILQTEREAALTTKLLSEYLGTTVTLVHPEKKTRLITFKQGIIMFHLLGVWY